MQDCVLHHLLQILDWRRVLLLEVDAAFAGLDTGMLFLEHFKVVSAASIQGNVILLVGDRDPSFSAGIGRHLVLQVDHHIREALHDQRVQGLHQRLS